MIERARSRRGQPLRLLVSALVCCAGCSDPQPTAAGDADTAAPARPALSSGLYKPARPQAAPTAEQRAEIERLEALGYATGSREPAAQTGVTLRDPRAGTGLNLYVSAHAPEAVVMDMDGQTRHVYRVAPTSIWRDPALRHRPGMRYFRRAYPLVDGGLLVIFEGVGLARIDAASRVVWSFPAAGDAQSVDPHHDLVVRDDGSIVVLTRRARIVPWLDPSEPVLDDFVSVLGPDGRERRRISILNAFGRSRFRAHLEGGRRGDLLHTNSIHVLDGSLAPRDAAFASGNLLLSMRNNSRLAIVDPDTEEVVWVAEGPFTRQHDAKIVPGGNLLLFDNGPKSGTNSRVLELDPVDLGVRWLYEGDPPASLHSATCGLAERLPNGHTLVIESNNGRAIEVTPTGEIVWEFRSPHRAGPQERYVATLFDLVRIPPELAERWTRASEAVDAPGPP